MKKIIFSLLIFFSVTYAYGQNTMRVDKDDQSISEVDCGLVAPPADNIYTIGGVRIKLILPSGWKIAAKIDEDRISFMPACLETSIMGVSVTKVPLDMAANWNSLVEEIKQNASKDSTCIKAEIINFSETKAVYTISVIGDMKSKQIQLIKKDKMFILSFQSSIDDFDKYLPLIEESFRTFDTLPEKPDLANGQEISLRKFYETYLTAIHKMQNFDELKDFLTLEALNKMRPPLDLTEKQVKEGISMIKMMTPKTLDKFRLKIDGKKANFVAEGKSSLGVTIIKGEMINDKETWKISSEEWNNENM